MGAIGCVVKAPSTLGTFLRSFRWGHVRQLDRVSRELLARAWTAGGGPDDEPLAIDLNSTVCEAYGLGKEGARGHNYTGQRGYHLLLAVAAGTGDVLMVRLRKGRANTARGAPHFLRERASLNGEPAAPPPPTVAPRKPTFLLKERWQVVQKARRKGMSLRAIERELGIHRSTIRRYLEAGRPPERQAQKVPISSTSDTMAT